MAQCEEDLDEVLQSDAIFANVSKGILAKHEDLQAAFQTTDPSKIVRQILEKGELQVSEKERQARKTSLFRDIANIIVEKCVDASNGPLPISVVERSMHEAHVSVSFGRSAKQQALGIIRQLQAKGIPIARAQMRVIIDIPDGDRDAMATRYKEHVVEIEKEDLVAKMGSSVKNTQTMTCLIDPGSFRKLEEAVRADAPYGSVRVLNFQVLQNQHADDAERTADGPANPSTAPSHSTASASVPPPAPGGRKGRGRRGGKKSGHQHSAESTDQLPDGGSGGKDEQDVDEFLEAQRMSKPQHGKRRRRRKQKGARGKAADQDSDPEPEPEPGPVLHARAAATTVNIASASDDDSDAGSGGGGGVGRFGGLTLDDLGTE